MNNLQIFSNPEFDSIRALDEDGKKEDTTHE